MSHTLSLRDQKSVSHYEKSQYFSFQTHFAGLTTGTAKKVIGSSFIVHSGPLLVILSCDFVVVHNIMVEIYDWQ